MFKRGLSTHMRASRTRENVRHSKLPEEETILRITQVLASHLRTLRLPTMDIARDQNLGLAKMWEYRRSFLSTRHDVAFLLGVAFGSRLR
jgi:hypothetical protein